MANTSFVLLLVERIKRGSEEVVILLAMNISGSIKERLQPRAFYLGGGISGNGVKRCLHLAGSALHLPLHPHLETAQAAENKSIGWNSPRGIFSSSLGNRGMFVNQILQREGSCSQIGCLAAVVAHESKVKLWALGESQWSAREGNTPQWLRGHLSHTLAFAFITGVWFHPWIRMSLQSNFWKRGWSPLAKGRCFRHLSEIGMKHTWLRRAAALLDICSLVKCIALPDVCTTPCS